MKKCNVNGNHFYSNHLNHCPWCKIRKDTGKDWFPDSTGIQMRMPAPTPIGGKWFIGVIIILAVLALGWYGTQDSSGPAIPTPQKTFTNSIGMDFVLIPAGEFDMGSPIQAGPTEESPVHHVKISNAFYMGKYEVTQKQWRDVMGSSPSTSSKGDNLPVETVSWNDIQNFITKLNEKEGGRKYRLPTEAEWEYAVRAGTTTRYFFGDDESMLGDYAWYEANSGSCLLYTSP